MGLEKKIAILLIEAYRGSAERIGLLLKSVDFDVHTAVGLYDGLSSFDPGQHHLVMVHVSTFDFDTDIFINKWQALSTNVPLFFLYLDNEKEDALDVIQFDLSGRVVYENRKQLMTLPDLAMKALLTQENSWGEQSDLSNLSVDDLRERTKALTQINSIGQRMAATHNPHEIILEMLDNAASIIRAGEASLWVWADESRETLICEASSNRDMHHKLQSVRLNVGEGVAGWVVQHQLSTISFDTRSDPRFSAQVDDMTGFQTESILSVPLWLHNEVLGVLEVLNKRSGMFSSDDAALVETLATSAAIALENARLMESLQRKTMELEARNRDLDAFAHTVSHDLKKPLNLAMNHFDLLACTVDPEAEEQEFVNGVNRNMDKMLDIINAMLLLASVNDADIEREPIDMTAVIAESLAQLTVLIEQHGAKIILPDSWPTAVGYAPWIERVWVNYISNALKYGGTPPVLTFGYNDDDPTQIKFWLKDNGQGLPQEDMAGLFKPFPAFRDARGHGLGLSIVKRIIDRLGGTVASISTIGEGSCFAFTLPRSNPSI